MAAVRGAIQTGIPAMRTDAFPAKCDVASSSFVKASRAAGPYGLALFLGACAIANTPQQDLAYARWAQCNSPSGHLERIDLDGRITFRFTSPGGREEIAQCLAEAGRTGPPLPAPVGLGLPGGP